MATPMSYGKSQDNGVFLQRSCKSDAAKKLVKALQSGEQDPPHASEDHLVERPGLPETQTSVLPRLSES